MRHWKLVVIMLVVLVAGIAPAGTSGARSRSPYDEQELRFLKLINDYRRDHDLKPLLLSDEVEVAARIHSRDMGEAGFFSHYSARGSSYSAGSAPWDRMKKEGYGYNTYTGENIAAGYETAEKAFEAWRKSPGHNRAMLSDRYRVMGLARVEVPGSKYRWYWTTDFGGRVDPSAHCGSANGDCGGIEGGSMDNEKVWSQKATDDAGLITRNGWARLGGYNSGRDDLSQRMRISEDSRLVYRLRVATEERRHPYDLMIVRLLDADGKHLLTLARHTDADAGDWRRESVELSRYAKRFAGKGVQVSFLARTDEVKPTTFYVDDVKREVRK